MITSDFTKLVLPLSNTLSRSTIPTPQNALGTQTGWVSLKEALDTYAQMTPKFVIRKLSADSASIATTLTNVFADATNITAGKKYYFKYILYWMGSVSSADLVVTPTFTTPADVIWAAASQNAANNSNLVGQVGTLNAVTFLGGASDVLATAIIEGYIDSPNGGSLNLQVSTNTGNTMTVKAGTTLILQELY